MSKGDNLRSLRTFGHLTSKLSNIMQKLLVTGATGFIGSALIAKLITQKHKVIAGVRQISPNIPSFIEQFKINKNLATTDWSNALQNVDVVIHTAARVHIMQEDNALDTLTEHRKVNVKGTLNLATQAAENGVNRFVFISTIKVNGELTMKNQSFTPNDKCTPTDPYGLSKYEAEQGLLALGKRTKMEVVIIRPPLVYGINVKGNFFSLITWLRKGIPLPFGSIINQRSMIGLDNLVNFILLCCNHPKASNEIFLISDDEDVSTPELLKKVAHAFNKKLLLLPIPVSILLLVAKLVKKEDSIDRLSSSLQVDISKSKQLLAWKPVYTMDEQLLKMSTSFP